MLWHVIDHQPPLARPWRLLGDWNVACTVPVNLSGDWKPPNQHGVLQRKKYNLFHIDKKRVYILITVPITWLLCLLDLGKRNYATLSVARIVSTPDAAQMLPSCGLNKGRRKLSVVRIGGCCTKGIRAETRAHD